MKRINDKEHLAELLKTVTFTKDKAFMLASFGFISASVGLLAFVAFMRLSYLDLQREVSAKIGSSLQSAAGFLESLNPIDRDLKDMSLVMEHQKLAVRIGPKESSPAARDVLMRVRGQKRLIEDGCYEVRFIEKKD